MIAPAHETPGLAAGAVSPGLRRWTLTFPAGLPLLSLNGRLHWAERNRRNATWKKAAWALAVAAHIPPLERVAIVGEYQPPDRRKRDEDNLVLTMKSAIDGIASTGCVPSDSSDHVRYDGCRIGERYPKGRLVLTVTELAP